MRPRHLIIILIVSLLLLPALPLYAAATGITVSSASGAVGQQADININIENPSGLSGGSFNLYYDPDTIEPIKVTSGEVLKGTMFESNLGYQGSQGTAVRAVWASTRGTQTGGILCTVTFKLLENGTSPLNPGEIELFDSNLKAINATVSSGTLVAGTGQKPANSPAADNSGSTNQGTANDAIPPFTGGTQTQTQTQTGVNKTGQQQQTGIQKSTQQPESPKQAVSPTNNSITFKDTARHWANSYIAQMAQARIMSGYQDGSFQPDKNITRAEFTRVIALAMKLQINQQASLSFQDRSQIGDWARPYIAAAVQAGIISGYSDGTFQPGQTITRAEMAVIIARAQKAGVDTNANLTFNDSAQIPDWARPHVAAAVKSGLITGTGNNTFAPQAPATRAQTACLITKLLNQ